MSSDGHPITHVPDADMDATLAAARAYSIVLLSRGPAYHDEGARTIIREHGRRNLGLRADGQLDVVCPMTDDGELRGIAIFNCPVDETERIMAGDPAIVAEVLRCEVRAALGFPGDSLAR